MPHHQPVAYPFRWAWLPMSFGNLLMFSLLAQYWSHRQTVPHSDFPMGSEHLWSSDVYAFTLKRQNCFPSLIMFSLRETPKSHSDLQTFSTEHWCAFSLYSVPICSSHCPLLWSLCIFFLLLSVDYLGPGVLLEAREEFVQSEHSRALRYLSKDDAHTALAHYSSHHGVSPKMTHTLFRDILDRAGTSNSGILSWLSS